VAGQRVRPANFDQAVPNLASALGRLGARLIATEHLEDKPADIAAAYCRQIERGAEVILVAGTIVLDPGDPYMVAVEELGGRITCQGAPIDPGTMFWVGEVGGAVFLGLASCELYGRLSILDLILPYAIAKEPISTALFAELGYGGLLEQTFTARRHTLASSTS
jgi:molybdopterin biosynthesis enzyme